MLDGDAVPSGETLAVSDAVDLVDDRNGGIAGENEVSVEGVRRPVVDGSCGGDKRLRNDEAAEDALPSDLGTATAIDVVLDPFEIEYRQKVVDRAHSPFAPGPPARRARLLMEGLAVQRKIETHTLIVGIRPQSDQQVDELEGNPRPDQAPDRHNRDAGGLYRKLSGRALQQA